MENWNWFYEFASSWWIFSCVGVGDVGVPVSMDWMQPIKIHAKARFRATSQKLSVEKGISLRILDFADGCRV